ncbi:hypothetical protein NPIL_272651 [Nephila pilipes]|uniref:Uncharacterized protein n=1 Tax=Nephila pilipes TaxID=299642 RepID=A0A8X6PE08_NEPPI|nr:hypothetical protein NPIL_272651 [Nephila pilipes]
MFYHFRRDYIILTEMQHRVDVVEISCSSDAPGASVTLRAPQEIWRNRTMPSTLKAIGELATPTNTLPINILCFLNPEADVFDTVNVTMAHPMLDDHFGASKLLNDPEKGLKWALFVWPLRPVGRRRDFSLPLFAPTPPSLNLRLTGKPYRQSEIDNID